MVSNDLDEVAPGGGGAAGMGVVLIVAAGVAVSGLLLSGEPTGISHLCPGCPCGGFIPGAVGCEEAGAGVVVVVSVPAGAVV